LNAIEAVLTACGLIGPLTKWSISSFGIDGIAAALPKIPKEVLDQIATDSPMSGQQINATMMALKKALIERALGGEQKKVPNLFMYSGV
jgi:hypothetical protein